MTNPNDHAPGYIYLLRDQSHHGLYKIGLARDVARRVAQIEYADLIHQFPADDMAAAEAQLHTEYSDLRLHGEWFGLTEPCVEAICEYNAFRDGTFQ